jgi:hypothetical protein
MSNANHVIYRFNDGRQCEHIEYSTRFPQPTSSMPPNSDLLIMYEDGRECEHIEYSTRFPLQLPLNWNDQPSSSLLDDNLPLPVTAQRKISIFTRGRRNCQDHAIYWGIGCGLGIFALLALLVVLLIIYTRPSSLSQN